VLTSICSLSAWWSSPRSLWPSEGISPPRWLSNHLHFRVLFFICWQSALSSDKWSRFAGCVRVPIIMLLCHFTQLRNLTDFVQINCSTLNTLTSLLKCISDLSSKTVCYCGIEERANPSDSQLRVDLTDTMTIYLL
jgi:myosin-crossreactive antigen